MKTITLECFEWHQFYGGTPNYCVRLWRKEEYQMPTQINCLEEKWFGDDLLSATTHAETLSKTYGGIIKTDAHCLIAYCFRNGGSWSERLCHAQQA